MVKHENPRMWNRGAESAMARADERAAGLEGRMEGVKTYVTEFLNKNDNDVMALIGQGFAEKINDNRGAAEMFAKQNDYYIPRSVKELGSEYEIAFVLQLAAELSSPEYNQ